MRVSWRTFIALRRAGHGHFGRLCLVLAFALVAAVPAFAWKPVTHMHAANLAIVPIMAGNNYVTVAGGNYPVDPRVADAIRAFPQFYRAGVCGPDLYPDMYVGQASIHPDTRLDNGTEPPGHFGPGHSFSYEWLRHIFEAGWQYYADHSGDSDAQKILAFTYGFMTHAAGDMWAHSMVNNFAEGVSPSWTDVANVGIIVRHIVVESGYIGDHTPPTDYSIAYDSPVLSDFIYWSMISGGKDGGFVDSANQDPWSLGRGIIFNFFFDLKWALDDRNEAVKGLGPLNPIYLLALPLTLYVDEWLIDIDNGLRAWPDMSQDIGQALVGTAPMDWTAAGDSIQQYVFDHLLSMLGFPDPLVYVIEAFVDVLSFFGDLIEPLTDALTDFRNWVFKLATGIDLVELQEYISHPANHINEPLIGLEPDTSARLDALMGIPVGSGLPFDENAFAPFKNTVTTSALILMTPDGLNQMLHDKRVGPMYQEGSLYSDKDGFMLGYIRTLDGHEQWRKNTDFALTNSPMGVQMSEGMPIWSDCLARDRVFRQIYATWEGQDFADNGESGADISATPPPVSMMAVLGPKYSNAGVTYVGGATTFQITGNADHFWNEDEISVHGDISPGGTPQSGGSPIVLGPIAGADGVYTVSHNATGACISGPPHAESEHTSSFTLDATPPTVNITPPAAGLILDVNQTTLFGFTAADGGSGLASSGATLDGAPVFNGTTIDAFLLTAGFHTLVATGTDNIGNIGTTTRTFRVSATIAGLKAAVARAYAEKLMTVPTKDLPVQSKLDNAQKSLNAGKVSTAKNQLSALAGQVSKYIGSGVDPAFGNRLVGWINDLVNRL